MALDSGTFSYDIHESFISSLEFAYREVLVLEQLEALW